MSVLSLSIYLLARCMHAPSFGKSRGLQLKTPLSGCDRLVGGCLTSIREQGIVLPEAAALIAQIVRRQ
jgi:hypothetical protein